MADPAAKPWTCPTCGNEYPREFALCPRDATPRSEQHAGSGDPLIGAVIGRTYRITRVLAEGGMARLYEAEHLRIDARFAVKVIHHELAGYADQLTRFEREARAAAKIHSEHVVRLADVLVTEDARPCIVSELLTGEDLQVRLDRVKKLSLAESLPIARQLCRAIADAHTAGVVHRDLKPSNIFLCQREGVPLVKVFDFGIAKLEDDEKLTRTGAVMGTAAYMAPEQARAASDAGPLADVYSIGAVLYHMLTGEPPYGNLPPVSRFALLLHEEPARPRSIEPSIPEGFEAVIQHAMARDRETRIASAAELDQRLAAFETTRPGPAATAAPAQGLEHTAAKIARRARIARPIAAALVAASSFAACAWIAALLAALVTPKSGGERALITIIALTVLVATAAVQIRGLHARWNSTPAIARYSRPVSRALLAGVVALGALELFTIGCQALFHAEPFGPTARLTLAAIAGGLGLRFERWIG
jgi:serine/threonine-protein kinase